MTRNEKILEFFRINDSAKYFMSKYFSYCPFNGSKYEFSQTQLHFLNALTSKEKTVNVIASRQRGTTSTMSEYAFWDAFMSGKTGRCNVMILPVLSHARQITDIIENSMELARDDILENTGIDISKRVTRTTNGIGFKDSNRNSLIIGSMGNISTMLRGKHVSTLYMDNTWMNSGKTYANEIALVEFTKACDTRIVMLQTGLLSNQVTYVENQPNVILLPDTLNANYTIEFEDTAINRFGARKFAQEYLLERIP